MPPVRIVKDLVKIIGTAGDSVRLAAKPGYIDDIAKLLGDVQDAKAMFVRDKVLLAIKSGDNPASVVTKLSKGDIAVPENLRRFIKTKYPLNDYSKLIDETNELARKLGFKDEADFAKFISKLDLNKNIRGVKDTQKLGRLSKYIKNYVAKHPTSVAKGAIAGGTIAFLVSYLKKFQAENTGCFRYAKDDENNLIRYKFEGNFCLDNVDYSDNSDASDTTTSTEKVKIIAANQHPLFGVTNKWDCDFSQFEKGNPTVDQILNAGCNGLCDWLNFNTLTGHTTTTTTSTGGGDGDDGDYVFDPLVIDDDDDNEYYMYIYKCEKATILRAITSGVSEVVDETLTGFAHSQLGRKTIEFLKTQVGQFISFVLILLLIYLCIKALNKHWMNHHQPLSGDYPLAGNSIGQYPRSTLVSS